eukprot:TRINITY_DN446_c1_g1_i1.p1 TRINITY_DN446_c1_g1~~TRINITY_DN446_c1_g1_i1.p1  ORF type:complete len:938 (-),score=103.42 TRINITY_DN446_c1_g1_i1:2622-5435(-)
MALTLAAVARRSASQFMERLHLFTGATALGFGIWSMHFIGMLAFKMPAHVHYHLGITMLSAIPSLVAAWVALRLLTRNELTGWRLFGGGIAVGAGIGTMHYLGMAAMEIGPALRYDPLLFVVSLIVAVVLGTLALWINFGLRHKPWARGVKRRVLAGTIMGFAVAGMHYTAMEAARFIGDPAHLPDTGTESHTTLAIAVALITFTLGLIAGGVNAIARYRALMQRSQEVAGELRAIVDAAVDGIIKISNRGIVLSFNESAERIFGYRADEVIGHNISMLMPNPHRDAHDSYLKNYLRTGQRKILGEGREVMALHKNGHQIPVRLAIGESRLGGISTFVGFITDFSERHKMETDLRRAKEEAEQAAEAKSAFLANMSHEIRTPMNAIMGFTDLVLDTSLGESQFKHLSIVRNSARSLLGLLNDILDKAKLDSGHTELEIRNFNLRLLCEQIVATQSLGAVRKGLALELEYHADHFFKGDPLRIQQVVLNLVSNAVKFTERGGVILSVEQSTSGEVAIQVKDTGIGIPSDRIDSIFEPFTQADASTTRRFGGTGLGTTIARQLVELMGGQISVTSTPGEGSTFQVSLPLTPGEAVDEDYTDQETRLPALKILIADDIPQNLELLSKLLKQRKHDVICAKDGTEAVEHYRVQNFDLVLMDIQMADLNGHDATRAIRQLEKSQNRKHTPVIALTAGVLEADRREALRSGMDGFAAKPIDLPELTSEIAKVMDLDIKPVQPSVRPSAKRAVANAIPDGAGTVVDLNTVNQLWPDNADHLSAMTSFLSAPENQPDNLRNACEQEGAPAAHRLRGVAGNLGLSRLQECLANLELVVEADDRDDSELWHEFRQRFDEARQWLAEQQPAINAATPDLSSALTLDSDTLENLIRLLSHGEIPDDAFIAIKPGLPEEVALSAATAMDDFDPQKAATILATYRSSLEES